MASNRPALTHGERRRVPWLRGKGLLVISAVAVLGLAAILFLALEVASNLRQLGSASSDNIQWTLSQAEVEYLEFDAAVHAALDSVADAFPAEDEPDLDSVRREFDIFYSRIGILSQGSLYRDVALMVDFSAALDIVQSFLDATTPLIDGSNADLRSALSDIADRTLALRPALRTLATSGLAYFAAEADARREGVSVTLFRLAGVTACLVVALAVLAFYFKVLNQRILLRERDTQQANDRMNTILSTALDGVIVSDTEGRVVEFNQAAETIFGYSRQEAFGQAVGALIVPDHLRAAHDAGVLRMKTGGPRNVVGKGRVRLDAKRANGDVFPVEMALQSAHSAGGEIVIAFIRDISHRVAAEQDLMQARDQALAGEKAKADFLAVMSHEIRTPLNGLLGSLALLRDTVLTDRQLTYAANMEVSGRQLMGHVNSILDIAKYEAGKMEILSQPVDLNALMTDVIDGQRGHAQMQGTEIDWQWLGPPLQWVLTDAGRLHQVLLNLLGNAVKFTRQGQVTIELECLPGKGLPKVVEFRVIDTGHGIPDEDLERIFEDFETRDASYGRQTGGTGLGLGIARRIVTAMDGEIGVESTVDEGSLFWVRLPLQSIAAPTAIAASPDRPDRQLQREILVVEDNAINRQVVGEMLRNDGHNVTEATDGLMGVQMAEDRLFDVILMDISMPVMDGRQATREIRNGSGKSRDVPIIALSANVMAKDIALLREDGMDGFLGKPLLRDDLRKTLSKLDNLGQTRLSDRAPAITTDPAIIDPLVNSEVRESLGGDAYSEIMERFCREADDLLAWIADLSQSPDTHPEIAAQCHKIAGTAAVFGALEFRNTLLGAENAARDGAADQVRLCLDALVQVWSRTRAALTG